MAQLNQKFWDKLTQVTTNLGMKPEDLVAVMCYESGLNPAAHNMNGDASGLIQFMPSTLKGVGFHDSPNAFRELDAIQQLDYVEKYIQNQMAFNGGPFKSAAQYYVANLWPVALKLPEVKAQNPHAVIIDSNPTVRRFPGVSLAFERVAYKSNAGLDVDHDGKITFGDLEKVMDGIKRGSKYQGAVAAIYGEHSKNPYQVPQEYANNKPALAPSVPANTNNEMAVLDDILQMLPKAADVSLKKLYKQALPNHDILIRISAPEYTDAIEFSRILCTALEEDLLATTYPYTDGHLVEVECNISGPHRECFAAVEQMTEVIAETFKEATIKIGGIAISTDCIMNKKSSYQPISLRTADTNYRKFLLKFI